MALHSSQAGENLLLTHEHVRHFIWDRTVEDNPLEMDLAFSDGEIGHAREYAAWMLNNLPPFTVELRPDVVPKRWQYPYLLATVYHLFLGKLMTLQRKDMDYSAGNMAVDINKRRIEYLSKWTVAFKEEAEQTARELKVAANLESAYGHF